jgi:hypothetical protein
MDSDRNYGGVTVAATTGTVNGKTIVARFATSRAPTTIEARAPVRGIDRGR